MVGTSPPWGERSEPGLAKAPLWTRQEKMTTLTGHRLTLMVNLVRNQKRNQHDLGGKNLTVLHHHKCTHVNPRTDGSLHFSGHILYRMFDHTGLLLYIGVTKDLTARCSGHSEKPWWNRVAWITIERGHPSRESLETAEAQAIHTERPLFNIEHNPSGWGQQLPPFGVPGNALRGSSVCTYELALELQAIARYAQT